MTNLSNYAKDNRTTAQVNKDYDQWKIHEEAFKNKCEGKVQILNDNVSDTFWTTSQYVWDFTIEWFRIEYKYSQIPLKFVEWKKNQYQHAKKKWVYFIQEDPEWYFFISPYDSKEYLEIWYCNKPTWKFSPEKLSFEQLLSKIKSMNLLIESIKDISFKEVLTAAGIKYEDRTIHLDLYTKSNSELSSGWKASLEDNIVSDFSHNRATWNPYDFIQKLFWYSEQETVEWFKSKWPMLQDDKKVEVAPTDMVVPEDMVLTYDMKTISDKWDSLQWCTQDQIIYMENRWIDYSKITGIVRNMEWRIWAPIQWWVWEEFGMLTIQSRDIHSRQFRIMKGTKSKWVFMHWINPKIKHIYVVEWLFDWLSLRQYYTNVVGLKSCNDGIEIVKDMMAKWYMITLISDNDEAGIKMLDKFADVDYYWLDLSEYWDDVKDLNDMLVWFGLGQQLIWAIEEQKQLIESKIRKDYEIKDYDRLLEKWLQELMSDKDPISWGFPLLNQILWYMMWGWVYLLWAATWVWKSTFCNKIADAVSRQWYKVWRFTMEDRQEDKRKEEIYYEVWRVRRIIWLENYPKHLFMSSQCKDKDFKMYVDKAVENLKARNKNILDVVNNTSHTMPISEVEVLVENFVKRWARLIIIDHLHYFKIKWSADRHDLAIEEVMQEINGIARKYCVDIILVAHYKKLSGARPNDESFKDSNSIGQVANAVMHIHRDKMSDSSETDLIITKNRAMWICTTLKMIYDPDIGTYNNIVKGF